MVADELSVNEKGATVQPRSETIRMHFREATGTYYEMYYMCAATT